MTTAWRYTFDDGPEKELTTKSGLYDVAAMLAFAAEDIRAFPSIKQGVSPYEGHVLKLWAPAVVEHYPAVLYGIAFNECGSLSIISLIKNKED